MATPAPVDALRALSDRELIVETHRLAERERHATAHIIAALMEVDARRLYLAEGCSSLFTYCTQVLHFSEHAAYGRIEAARTAQRFPVVLNALEDGAVTLTTVGLLAPHLTPGNHVDLLSKARHRSKRDVEQLIAAIRPLPAVPSSIRKLPQRRPARLASPEVGEVACSHDGATGPPVLSSVKPAGEVAALPSAEPDPTCRRTPLSRPAVVAPLAPERYKVQITISREAHDKLRRAQDLLRHVVPDGDLAAIFERAVTLLVEDLERKKLAVAKRPRPAGSTPAGSRRVPAAVKRSVWERDGGRCAFVGTAGRCTERGLLEFHHVIPFAEGGLPDVANLQLRCRAHNAYEAETWFGPLVAREVTAAYANSVRTELLVS